MHGQFVREGLAETVRQVVHQVYNNAGITYNGDVEKSEFKDIERIIDVDFWGVVNGTKAFLPHVIASGDGHRAGTHCARLTATN
jgi:NADP-dependent 3-hydroxy acid dehydrogenase YdfG